MDQAAKSPLPELPDIMAVRGADLVQDKVGGITRAFKDSVNDSVDSNDSLAFGLGSSLPNCIKTVESKARLLGLDVLFLCCSTTK